MMVAHAKLVVHKFGGTSLQNADAYRHIATLLTGRDEALVLSASADTTQILQSLIDQAITKKDFHPALKKLQNFQQSLIEALIPEKQQLPLKKNLFQDIENIS